MDIFPSVYVSLLTLLYFVYPTFVLLHFRGTLNLFSSPSVLPANWSDLTKAQTVLWLASHPVLLEKRNVCEGCQDGPKEREGCLVSQMCI